MKKLLLINILFVLFSSCSKNDDNPVAGPITLEFDNRIDEHPGFTITYDVTDIKLKRDDGFVFDNKTQSYHVDASDEGSQEISLKDLPSGNYTEVTFAVKSLNVHGDFDYTSAESTHTLTLTGAPVRAEHEPEVHLIFNVDKVNTSMQDAFVVDHIHAN
jgi:hypothetical protein